MENNRKIQIKEKENVDPLGIDIPLHQVTPIYSNPAHCKYILIFITSLSVLLGFYLICVYTIKFYRPKNSHSYSRSEQNGE